MKDRIVVIIALLIFAMMPHPQRRGDIDPATGRWSRAKHRDKQRVAA